MEKPILFNTEMVKAIIEDRKTCTRRIIKKKYENANVDWFENKYGKRLVYVQNDIPASIKNPNGTTTHKLIAMEEIKKPYKVGDILYVRETYADHWLPDGYCKDRYVYKVDGPPQFGYWGNEDRGKFNVWIPSIHMPKDAARIFLKVVSIKAERIQDITEEDAMKEGAGKAYYSSIYSSKAKHGEKEDNYIDGFHELWNECYRWPKTWEGNPWVWVIEFEKNRE
ncbi:hypothetical protein CLPUN_42010 [Clostridium puniceum]|uniref:ASCH domain protein n=1 Tax=Clostridium puniceum TaxID=29367 RepID=A0A1S8T891_9CLOT|nr:hypothetical protein [Clostridium puniceum]OOM73963.1 hypothetical protein CLPUN_42010 [Clostridium puniceum]